MKNYLILMLVSGVIFSTKMAEAGQGNLRGIEELLNQSVTSVSKSEEKAFDVPAALYVITYNDIRDTGATSIAELLRLVPGMNVARSDSSNWIVSSRGFKDTGFSNKLLVLVDGRSVYTPLFSGVYWDIQDVVLEDIDRIEVIRGPGATLWGANAVNGVINIITKGAKETQGNLITASVGNEDRFIGSARTGRKINDSGYFRTYIKSSFRDESVLRSNGMDAGDPWRDVRSGFRFDSDKKNSKNYTVQGDVYHGVRQFNINVPDNIAPDYIDPRSEDLEVFGGNLLSRLSVVHNNGSSSTFQAYIDSANRDYSVLEQNINTLDFDYQNIFIPKDKHEVTWGGEYRLVWDNTHNSTEHLLFTPDSTTVSLYSMFMQDKIELVPEKVTLTIGSKFEYNDLSQFEFQPGAKAVYKFNDANIFWGSVSRAVRTPSIADEDITVSVFNLQPGTLKWQGSDSFKSEELIAYEIGYRTNPTSRLSVDTALFFNDYDKLRTFEDPDLNGIYDFSNKSEATSYGLETAVNYEITPKWKIKTSYSYLDIDVRLDSDSTDIFVNSDERLSPRGQFNLLSNTLLPYNIELNNNFYFVSDMPKASNTNAYLRYDMVINWQPKENIELSLAGQNLLDDRHQEYSAPYQGSITEIERAFYGKVKINF